MNNFSKHVLPPGHAAVQSTKQKTQKAETASCSLNYKESSDLSLMKSFLTPLTILCISSLYSSQAEFNHKCPEVAKRKVITIG